MIHDLLCSTPHQGGAEMVLNRSGPVHSRNQTERWLLLNRDMMAPAESHVGLILVQFSQS